MIAFVAFLVRQLTTRNPLVDLKVFKHRNFAVGCVLIGLFGGVYTDWLRFCRCSTRR